MQKLWCWCKWHHLPKTVKTRQTNVSECMILENTPLRITSNSYRVDRRRSNCSAIQQYILATLVSLCCRRSITSCRHLVKSVAFWSGVDTISTPCSDTMLTVHAVYEPNQSGYTPKSYQQLQHSVVWVHSDWHLKRSERIKQWGFWVQAKLSR